MPKKQRTFYSVRSPWSEQGYWSTSAQDVAAHGTLRYSPGQGLRLSIPDCPADSSLRVNLLTEEANSTFNWVFGHSHRDATWLLDGAFVLRSQGFPNQRGPIELHANTAYRVNTRIHTAEFAIRSIEICSTDIGNWPHGENFEWSHFGIRDVPPTFIPSPTLFGYIPSLAATVYATNRTDAKTRFMSHSTVRPLKMIGLRFDAPQPHSIVSHRAYDLRNLLSLLRGGSVKVDTSLFKTDLARSNSDVSVGGCFVFSPIDSLATPTKLPIPQSEISKWAISNFTSIAISWFDLLNQLELLIVRFFSVFHARAGYVEDRFLTIAHIMEALHRHSSPRNFMPDDEFNDVYQAMISNIPANAPSSWRDSVKTRLRFSNERSLRVRLQDLLVQMEPEVRQCVTKRSPADWAGLVADARNVLVHTPDPSGSEASASTIAGYTAQMEMIFLSHLLKKLGMPPAMVCKYLISLRSFGVASSVR